MSEPTFGYAPNVEAMDAAQDCDEAIRRIGARKQIIHQLMQRHRSPAERAPYVEELARLDRLRRDVIIRREVLMKDTNDWFNKTFRRIVREAVGDEQFNAWVDEARAHMTAYAESPAPFSRAVPA